MMILNVTHWLCCFSYRLVIPEFKDAPAFGVMLVGEQTGVVRVGDKVYATK